MNSSSKKILVDFSESEPANTIPIRFALPDARAAQGHWAQTPMAQRLELVRKLRQLIVENAMPLAEASGDARNRPSREALTAEVMPLAEACRFLERNAEKILAIQKIGKRHRPLWLARTQSEIVREPFGVILIIGPGNYPLLLPGVQLIQALVAGNAVLLKPGSGGTAAAKFLCELVLRAGFDSRLVTLLAETNDAAREAIEAGPNKVLFTGSAATGEKILAQLASQLIPATMELSGCDAVIIRADANLDLVTKALKFGLTFNGGATCLAPKRVFVARSIATELEGRLATSFAKIVREQKLSEPIGDRLQALVENALSHGAHFVAGEMDGKRNPRIPIVLGGVSAHAQLLRDDIFLPIISLVTVSNDAEALALTNDCPFALGVSIFSRDENQARHLANEVNAGVVTINDLICPTADARTPFGGRNRSGFGTTRGAEGLLELTTPKVVSITRGNFRPAFDESRPGDEKLFEAYLRGTHAPNFQKRFRAFLNLIKTLLHRRKSSTGKL